jgi:choline transport protein
LDGCVLWDGNLPVCFPSCISAFSTNLLTTRTVPAVAYQGALQVQALISICDRNYVIQGWHSALITMAFVLAAIFFNTAAIGKLPVLEGLAVILHVFGFVAFITILWVM